MRLVTTLSSWPSQMTEMETSPHTPWVIDLPMSRITEILDWYVAARGKQAGVAA